MKLFKKHTSLPLALLLSLVGATASMNASPMQYTINFTTGQTAPSSGGFVYDAATENFVSFTIVWKGATFDMTAEANAPTMSTLCNTAADDSVDFFTHLTGGCGTRTWSADFTFGSDAQFRLGDSIGTDRIFANLVVNFPIFDTDTGSAGTYTVAPVSSVPEPSAGLLVLAGGALMGWKRFRATHRTKLVNPRQ